MQTDASKVQHHQKLEVEDDISQIDGFRRKLSECQNTKNRTIKKRVNSIPFFNLLVLTLTLATLSCHVEGVPIEDLHHRFEVIDERQRNLWSTGQENVFAADDGFSVTPTTKEWLEENHNNGDDSVGREMIMKSDDDAITIDQLNALFQGRAIDAPPSATGEEKQAVEGEDPLLKELLGVLIKAIPHAMKFLRGEPQIQDVDRIGLAVDDNAIDKEDEFSWQNFISVAMRFGLALFSNEDNALEKADSYPQKIVLGTVISAVTGSTDPEEVVKMARQANAVLNLVSSLFEAVQTSFSS